jgi:hypothetical protein
MNLFEITSVNIDNKDGWGAVPNNQEVDYFGLRVRMKPSVFLNLAATLTHPTSSDKIVDHLKNGGAIGSPFLDIDIPPEWENGDYAVPAKVSGHEGRNRMLAVKAVHGDEPIEVHLFFRHGIRSRHITKEWMSALVKQMVKERSSDIIKGPLFSMQKTNLSENRDSYDWLEQYTEYGYNKYPSENELKYLLNKYPNEEPLVLYRGLHFDTEEQYNEFMAGFKNKVRTSSISSWSPSFDTAEEFSITKKTYHPNPMIMSQEMERERSKEYMTGYRGIVLKTSIQPNTGIMVNRTGYAKENEVILPPGTYDVQIQTITKKYKHKIEDGDETVTSIIDKMMDPKYRDDHYYKNFFEFVKHNYPEDIRQSDALKQKIVKIISQRQKKLNYVEHELHTWTLTGKYTDVRIYFNYSIFELFEKGFLPDKYKKYVENYANKIIQEYHNLVKQYSGKEYVYQFGNLRYLENYASPKYVALIRKILQIQVVNTYAMMNDREEIDRINSIKDSNQKRNAIEQYTKTIERIIGQLK